MKIYFVRHGETEGNKNSFHQTPHTPLTETGLLQAKKVAKRFKTIDIDIILASDYTRTQQTAAAISKVTSKEIISTPLLRETKNPSAFANIPLGDKSIRSAKEMINARKHDAHWHHSDEENFYDFTKRAYEFMHYLQSLEYSSVAVVSHGAFLAAIVSSQIFQKSFSFEVYRQFFYVANMTNTGITMCELTKENGFRLLTWNDYAHLGE